MVSAKQLVVRLANLAATLIVWLLIIIIGVAVLGVIAQYLPILYQIFSTNVQVIVGLAEVIVAIALLFSVGIEGSSFLLDSGKTIMKRSTIEC